MKCSLLTLSTFVDGELAPDRRADVDAHLVGCPRCGAGAATLREERARIAHLARVHVDPDSRQVMLEQVGIMVPAASAPEASHAPARDASAWVGIAELTTSAPAPMHGSSIPPAHQELTLPKSAPDQQPDLAFDQPAAVAGMEQGITHPGTVAAPAVLTGSASVASEEAPRSSAGEAEENEWLESAAAPESWEAELPPPIEHDEADLWAPPHEGVVVARSGGAPEPPPLQPARAPVPTRLEAPSGPAALWSRVHDAVAVRLALARGGEGADDSMQIVSGPGPARGMELPSPAPDVIAAATSRLDADTAMQSSVELNGTRGVGLPSRVKREVRGSVPAEVDVPVDPRTARRSAARPVQEGDQPAPAEPAAWNAFAASSYPAGGAVPKPGTRTVGRTSGRHSRAVAAERTGAATRLKRGTVAAIVAARARPMTGAKAARKGGTSAGRTGPNNRLLAGVAGIGLIFVVALLIGHVRQSAPPAVRPSATSAAVAAQPPPQQAPPPPASAVPATTPAPTPAAQAYGNGGTGFEVSKVRYGEQGGFSRMVFDLGAGSSGTPKVTLAYSDPKTLLVTFTGAVPAGALASPPAGSRIVSVSLSSSGGHATQYRLVLDRAATATAFYLVSPTRFVLDLH